MKLIYILFLNILIPIYSSAEDVQMVYNPKADCQLFEIDDKGQWLEVSAEFIKNKPLVVTSNAVQPNHYYFVQQDRWFSSLKSCFKKPETGVAKKYPKQTVAEKAGIPKTVIETPTENSNDLSQISSALDESSQTTVEAEELADNAKANAETEARIAKMQAEKKKLAKLQQDVAKAEAEKKAAQVAAVKAEKARKKAYAKKDAAKAEAARIAAIKAEAARVEAEKIAAAKAEVLRQESAKQEALRQELAKLQQENAEAKAAAAKAASEAAKARQSKTQGGKQGKSSFGSNKFKLSVFTSGIWWTDTFYITANNTLTPIDINAKQTGIMTGVSLLSASIAPFVKYSASLGFVYALSRTSSNIASVTYDTNGISVYGGYLSGAIYYTFNNQNNVFIGLEPFLMYRKGEWVTPAPNGRITYTLQDQAALRYGALFDLRNYLSNNVYLSPKAGFFQKVDNLTFIIELGVGI